MFRYPLIHLFLVLLQACGANASAQKAGDPPPADKREKQAHALFSCVQTEFGGREVPIYIQNDDKRMVISEYEPLGPQLRRRFIARVISVPQGLAFNITAEYERRDASGDVVVWKRADDLPTLKRAHREEQKWGESIGSCFKSAD